jgi:hypothetical protein
MSVQVIRVDFEGGGLKTSPFQPTHVSTGSSFPEIPDKYKYNYGNQN